jgi:hypothetical protein
MVPEPEQVDAYTLYAEMIAAPPEDAGAPADAAVPDVGADAAPAAPDAGAPEIGVGSDAASADAAPATLDSAALRSWFDSAVMWRLADEVVPSHDLQIELWLDADGRVTYAALHRISLLAERKRAILDFLRTLSAAGEGAARGRYLFDVTREQLDEVRAANSQIFEEAPYPYPPTQMHESVPPTTHPHEMIAPPLQELQKKK